MSGRIAAPAQAFEQRAMSTQQTGFGGSFTLGFPQLEREIASHDG